MDDDDRGRLMSHYLSTTPATYQEALAWVYRNYPVQRQDFTMPAPTDPFWEPAPRPARKRAPLPPEPPIPPEIQKANEATGLSDKGPESIKCTICLETVTNMTSTSCGHVFCGECIRNAVQVSNQCPICRTKLTLGKLHRLFL